MTRSEIITLVIAISSLIFASLNQYNSNDKELATRITAVETQQHNDTSAIIRMESKLDRLVEWTRGQTSSQR